MFLSLGFRAVELLVGSAEQFDDGIVAEYFNSFTFEGCGLLEWAEILIIEPEFQCKEDVTGVLRGIEMALDHNRDVFDVYSRMVCAEHTLGLPYPVLVTAILDLTNDRSCLPVPMVFTCRCCGQTSFNVPAQLDTGTRARNASVAGDVLEQSNSRHYSA